MDTIEQQNIRNQKIVDLRDKYKLTFRVIGNRLGLHSSTVSTLYKKQKKIHDST